MNTMELRHLRAFMQLAQDLHFGKAAAALHVVQPALSATIKSLESEVGGELFLRANKRVSLSPAGSAFLPHAVRSLEAARLAAEDARRAHAGETGRVHLEFALLTMLSPVPRTVATVMKERPGLQVRIRSGTTASIRDSILRGDCDIGFCSWAPSVAPLRALPVLEAPLMVVVSRGHRLARAAAVTVKDLHNQPMVMLRRDGEPDIWRRFHQLCARSGFEPVVAVEVEHADALLAMVEAGVGLSLAPAFASRLTLRGVTYVPFQPAIPSGVMALHDPTRLSPAAQHVLSRVVAAAAHGAPVKDKTRTTRSHQRG